MLKKAGCVLINRDLHKIGLIYREHLGDVTFPKGHLEEGESLEECAIRETAEETKRGCEIIGDVVYLLKYRGYEKVNCECSFYLALDVGASNNKSTDTHELRWTDFDDVQKELTYKEYQKMWKVIKNKVKELLD